MALRNLCMFLDIFEIRKQRKKKEKTVKEKCFDNIVSVLCKKCLEPVPEMALKRSALLSFLRFMCFYFFALFSRTKTVINPKSETPF